MIIGFTGTQRGMNAQQQECVFYLLLEVWEQGVAGTQETFIHGDCVGADEQAFLIAKYTGDGADKFRIVARPCIIESKRAYTKSDYIYKSKDPIPRNHDIVNDAELMIAAPAEEQEVLRSGTWATIRYAKKTGSPLVIIYPSGRYEVFSENDLVVEFVNNVFRPENSGV